MKKKLFFYFHSPISREQREIENALVIFNIKDRDLFGISNQYVAECFIPFAEIEHSNSTEQKHLTLNRPMTTGLFRILLIKN